MQTNLFDPPHKSKSPHSKEGADPDSKGFSDWIVYVDESGDYSLSSIDSTFPIFVLAFCVFHKKHYWDRVVKSIERFKFQHFGHDVVILHEREIRKESGHFQFKDRAEKQQFMDRLTLEIVDNNFILISCVIDKNRIQAKPGENAYHIALRHCLDSLFELITEKKQSHKNTHVIVECRGNKEDKELELEFRRICGGENSTTKPYPFQIVFADKKVNSPGLQLADLVARPIGLKVLKPTQPNRAFEVLEKKFFCEGGRDKLGVGIHGWGLKVFPPQKAKGPDDHTEATTPTGNPQST